MRVVADTNIAVSGLLWGGKPRQLLQLAANQQLTILSTDRLLDELLDVVSRPRFHQRLLAARTNAIDLVADYRFLVEVVTSAEIKPTVLADPDDDAVIACALGGKADYIVSGDDHLLSLKLHQGIPILTVHEILVILSPK